ncbi:hypothetical protein GGQ88_000561 [Novosphingobium hassiacum]|uniref:Amidohydrolase 3 domain-containing protein n=1 Tax=Novosphingobium hassiacum TaxID=173676 RepID=A0A7W6EUN5_9SPHN|nr:amidohydrolase [Novosphingobium hassiacum]MBB3859321.1 hypothetical protein [Novosphingobium hassiacum]
MQLKYLAGLAAFLLQTVPGLASEKAGPSMILLNGKIVSVDAKQSQFEAIAIDGEKIEALGKTAEIRKLARKGTKIVDLQGRTVIPGLIDGHIHAIRAGAEHSSSVVLGEARSISDVLSALRTAAQQSPEGDWLLTRGGWHINQLSEQRAPTAAEIDSVAPHHPVFLLHQYGFIVLNKLAMQRLGISSQADVAAPLQVVLGPDGAPNGIIIAKGGSIQVGQLLTRLPKPKFQNQVAGTESYFKYLNSLGITGVIDDGGVLGAEQYQPIFDVWRRRRLTVRVRYNLQSVTEGQELANVQQLTQMTPPLYGDGMLRALGIGEYMTKGMFDTSFLSPAVPRSNEAMKEGLVYARWVASKGYALEVHVTHDETAQAFLDIFEELNTTTPIAQLRWKLAHCDDCTEDTLRRMKALGMGYAVQDRTYFDGDDFVAGKGIEVARRSPAVGTAVRLGLNIGGGSDGSVVSPVNPFIGLRWLVTGLAVTGTPLRAPSELVSRMDALRIYTLNNAWMSFEENDRGSLESGKLADMVILDRDYLTVPVEQIGEIRPLATMVGGKIVYAAEPFATLR